jgi:hypothetical protein
MNVRLKQVLVTQTRIINRHRRQVSATTNKTMNEWKRQIVKRKQKYGNVQHQKPIYCDSISTHTHTCRCFCPQKREKKLFIAIVLNGIKTLCNALMRLLLDTIFYTTPLQHFA